VERLKEVVTVNAGLRVTHEDGDRFTIEIRGHSLTVDQPESDGGTDFGPQPTELFVASLASCVAHYGRRFLRRHGLPDDVTVDAEWTMASSPTRVLSIRVSVAAPGLPGELEPRFADVIEHCTVHNALVIPPNVTINVNEVGRPGRPAMSIN
jgi:putative redox protein